MNKMRRISLLQSICFLTLILLAANVNAQDYLDIAEVSYDDGAYKKALKNAMEATEDPDYKKEPKAYYLVALSLSKLYDDPYYLEKNPETIKEAMKYLSKGVEKDPGTKEYANYKELIDTLIQKNNKEADGFYKTNKLSKALKAYQESFRLGSDTVAFYWTGKVSMDMLDTAVGRDVYSTLITWYDETFSASGDNSKFVEDPFLYFANYHWTRKNYDSASYYLEMGRRIFGPKPGLNFYLYSIGTEQVNTLPPSTLLLETIKKYLGFFPADTFFSRKENALYLYLIRTNLSKGDTLPVDMMLHEFCNQKSERATSTDVAKYMAADEFVEEKPENVLWMVSNYYFNNGHNAAANFTAKRYIEKTADSNTNTDLENRWVVIIDYSNKSKSLAYTQMLIATAMQLFPDSKSLKDMRRTITMAALEKDLKVTDKGALRELINAQEDLKGNAAVSKVYMDNLMGYIDGLIFNKHYMQAKKVIDDEKLRDPLNPVWADKYIYLAKEDFYFSFYETRIRPDTVAGMIINQFKWNGATTGCKAGDIDPKIHQKVETRINYFRRNANVPLIYLDPQLNDWCQKAVLMMESNRKLDHEPTKTWTCYSPEGAEAAKYSLLSQNSNTTMAITGFVADNNNTSLGNRRWMLYYNSKSFGHGSTDNYCSIWALDDSGSTDTSIYKDQFVAWPPEGYLPKMVVFKNWSFSIYRDLKGANVTMTENGKPVVIKQHPLVEGYGMPTLVWTPEVDLAGNTANRNFEVSIKLTDGRLYKFMVNAFDFDPVGY